MFPIIFSPALICQVPAQEPDFTGSWVFKMEGDDRLQRVTLVKDAKEPDKIKGKVYGTEFTATQKGDLLTFNVGNYLWSGTIKGNEITGELGQDEANAKTRTKWSAKRFVKPTTPKNYDYAPKVYHRLYSNTPEPALRLEPGDTVRTKTVDASGANEKSEWVTRGGNPLVGPFHIEGAVPGDVLVVKMRSVKTNRGWAFSGRALMDTVLDTDYIRNRTFGGVDNAWMIDTKNNIVSLEKPTERLKNFSVPLTPFLGCVGVAPAEGSMSSKASGEFGGNMECRFIGTGATIYLPVFQEGAYLFLGDGHAAQGDGELTGDALETSMDIEFSVDVLPGLSTGVPRVETATDILSIGIAGSLDIAIRTATSDMARWLERDYKLTSSEAAMVLGFANHYDIPDMVPPYISIASRVSRKTLDQLSQKKESSKGKSP
jgi:amidase